MAMALASSSLKHFVDPYHPLRETQYSHAEAGHCSICLLRLAGHRGYGCYLCNIHLHAACAGHFEETISFFAHPSHTLKLIRSPGRLCDICRGDCPQGSFVYSCIGCGFDVHSLCAMLPETAANPFHPGHELCMVSSQSPGYCSACHHPLHMWRYISSSVELHIECCAIDPPNAAAGGQSSNGHRHAAAAAACMGSYAGAQISSHPGAVGQRSFGGGPGATGAAPITPGRVMTAIAKFLLRAALSAAVSDLVSQLLPGSFN